MATTTVDDRRATTGRQSDATVIFASSLGTVFEWYDFYIYGTLGAILASKFFSGVAPTSAFIFTLLAFAAGFAVRPFGALVFGRLGDIVGRKYTFLVTMTLMGIGTFLIGVLPTYAPMGHRGADPADRCCASCRASRSAASTAARRPTSPSMRRTGKRGFYTSWIQTTATLGLFMALLVILGIRTVHGRGGLHRLGLAHSVPALGWSCSASRSGSGCSSNESPMFQQMKDEGTHVQGAAQGSVRQLVERQDRDPRAARRHRRRGGGVVRRTVLRAVLPHPDPEGARGRRADHDRDRARDRHAVLHLLRLALRQDRPQADHAGGLPARRS